MTSARKSGRSAKSIVDYAVFPGILACDGAVGINEDRVKDRVKKMCAYYRIWHWSIAASKFGRNGIGDFLLTKDNVFANLEAKGVRANGTRGEPNGVQLGVGKEIWGVNSTWFVVDDRNVTVLPLLLQAEGFPCYAPYRPDRARKIRPVQNNRD